MADYQGLRISATRSIIGGAYSGEHLERMPDALTSFGVVPSEIAAAMSGGSGCGHPEGVASPT
jgi:hypothetical protein